MDWDREFKNDTQVGVITRQFNDAIATIEIPPFEKFNLMTLDERNEIMVTANLKALRAAAIGIKRLLDLEEMPDRSVEMRVHRMMTADRLWHQRIIPFRMAVEMMFQQFDKPDLFKELLKRQ